MRKMFILKRSLVISVICAVLVLIFFFPLSDIGKNKTVQDKIQLENAIKNAAVSCYAIEGSYPPSIAYLVENYGIQIDTNRFTVKYELFASNLMPDITVLINKNEN